MSRQQLENRQNIYLLEKRLSELYNLQNQVIHNGLEEFRDMFNSIRLDLELLIHTQYMIRSGDIYPIISPSGDIPDLPLIAIPNVVMDFSLLIDYEFDIYNNSYYSIPITSVNNPEENIMTSNNVSFIEPTSQDIKIKTMILDNEKLESINENMCGICLESHKIIESIYCDCSHEFGEKCFLDWKNNCTTKKKDISCPNCRNTVKEIIYFTQNK